MKRIINPDNNMWRSADPPQRAERVAARIGGGGLKVIDQEHGLSDKSGSVFKQSLRQINDRILENNDINCIANGLSSNDKLTIDMNEVPERLQAELITDYDEFRQMIADAQSIHHNEPDVYFYHSDHLGSASWITDNGGLAVQHLQYLPYGERYVDQRISGYSEQFTFTGKEKDSETSYYYFGARYYDCDLSGLFLSVDPMADKYPSISPYAYCAWNPVKLVDPDGRDIYRLDAESGSLMLYKKNKKNYDVIEVGTTNKIGRATLFNKKSEKRISKGILEGKENQDISQTGFVTCSNRQEEALEVAVFISFSCHKELSGVGYEGIMGNQDLEVFAWANNTSNNSRNPVIYSPSKGGESKFHFHTHCGNKNGKGGYAKPEKEDKNTAATLKKTSGINTFVIISKRGGSVLYDENGKKSIYFNSLPKSVHSKY